MNEKKKVLVIAHGDLDGIISAALVMKQFDLQMETTKILFTQPFLLDKVEVDENIEKVFVVDIAVNNRDTEITRKFIEKIGDRLEYWVDHHQGWSGILAQLSEEQGQKFSIFEHSQSTARIIAVAWRGIEEWIADANASNTRQSYRLSARAYLIKEAIKADPSDNSVRETAVRWIVNGWQVDEDYDKLSETRKKYWSSVQAETERLAEQYKIHHGIAVVDVRDSSNDYNETQLLLKGERVAPTETAVVLRKNPEGEEVITIATMDQQKNLVRLFGLPSGASFKVNLPVTAGWTIEKVLETLSH